MNTPNHFAMNISRFAWTAICLIIEIVLFFNLMEILFDLRAKGILIGEAIDDPHLSAMIMERFFPSRLCFFARIILES